MATYGEDIPLPDAEQDTQAEENGTRISTRKKVTTEPDGHTTSTILIKDATF